MEILNQKTLKVLQNFNSVSNSAIISYPVTCIRDGQSIQAFINVEKLGETEDFNSFGLFDISSFLSAVSLVDRPVINLTKTSLEIKNEKSNVNYFLSNKTLLEDTCSGDFTLIERVKNNDKVAEFSLTTEDIKNIKIASNTLKDLPHISFIGKDDSVLLKIHGPEKSSNTYETVIDGTIENEFNVSTMLNTLKKIPNGNYLVEVYKSKKNNSNFTMLFTSSDIEGIEILLGIKNNKE